MARQPRPGEGGKGSEGVEGVEDETPPTTRHSAPAPPTSPWATSFLIYGAGALGSLFGARLALAGHRVTLLGRPAHVEAIRERGLLVTGLTEGLVELEAVANLGELASAHRFDLILVMVKAYATTQAAGELAQWLEERGRDTRPPPGATVVVSFQNGLDNLTGLAANLGPRPLLGGLTSHGAIFVDWGHIHHAGIGYTVVGQHQGEADGKEGSPSTPLRTLKEALDRAGIETSLTGNLTSEVWAKGLVNCAINPVTALSGLTNGALLQGPLRRLARQACQEGAEVARAAGVTLPGDPWERVGRVISETAKNRSSMLQDLQRGRRTEINAISGAVVRLGATLGVPTPVNNTLWRLVQGVEAP